MGRIVLTGAGGWVGFATIDLLNSIFSPEELSERLVCFGASSRALILRDGTQVRQYPLAAIATLPVRPTTVLHTAFLTKERAATLSEEDYRAANTALSNRVCQSLVNIGCERLFVASSGAAYRADDLGAPSDLRLYGALKRDDEERFAKWSSRYGTRTTIARIFSLSGPYINKHSTYALASFILTALAGRPIQIQAPREVYRSYIAVQELITLVLAELLAEDDGVSRFDTGGIPMEMEEIGTVIAGIVNRVSVARAPIMETEPDRYFGDGASYASLLARHRLQPTTFYQQIRDTADFLGTATKPSATAQPGGAGGMPTEAGQFLPGRAANAVTSAKNS